MNYLLSPPGARLQGRERIAYSRHQLSICFVGDFLVSFRMIDTVAREIKRYRRANCQQQLPKGAGIVRQIQFERFTIDSVLREYSLRVRSVPHDQVNESALKAEFARNPASKKSRTTQYNNNESAVSLHGVHGAPDRQVSGWG